MNKLDKIQFLQNYRAEKDQFVMIQQLNADNYPAAKMRLGFVGAFITSIVLYSLYEIHSPLVLSLVFPVLFIIFTFLGNSNIFKRLAILDIEVAEETRQRAIEMFYQLKTKNKRIIVYFELEQVAFMIDENFMCFAPDVHKSELK
jgi:hypothetical protein